MVRPNNFKYEFKRNNKIIGHLRRIKWASEVECQFGFQLGDVLLYLVFADVVVPQV